MKALGLAIGCLCVSVSVHAVGVSGQGTWETTLQGRDLDGNLETVEAYYDTVLGITWLADANVAGVQNWEIANSWATTFNPNGSGITGWRLSTVIDSGTPGCNNAYTGTDCGYNVDTSTGEMASLFYDTLGNLAYYDTSGNGPQSGYGLSNTGPFSNIQPSLYWSATMYAFGPAGFVWEFEFDNGNQDRNGVTIYGHAWAVHDGDVGTALPTSAVPLPASIWLLGSGLLGLIGLSKRRNAA